MERKNSVFLVLLILIIFSINLNINFNSIKTYIDKNNILPGSFINSASSENLKVNNVANLTTLKPSYYPNIAFVMPTFTAAAYSGFYTFYSCYLSGSCKVQDGYKYFIRKSQDSWGTSYGADSFISDLISEGYPAQNIHIIRDQDVHFGNLYDNYGRPKYSSIIFFHNEYVTLPEYYNTINYIKAGGNVIILNGNAFYAEVDYNPANDMVYLVAGHSFQFDGQNGTYVGAINRFWESPTNNQQFKYLGSRYSTFKRGTTNGATIITNSSNPHPIALELQSLNIQTIASYYISHEENSLITSNAHLIAKWITNYPQPDRGDFIYEFLPEGPSGGSVIHFSFYGTDILSSDYNSRIAFLFAVRYQAGLYNLPWIRYPENGGVYNSKDMQIDFTRGYKTNIYLNGTKINENSVLLKNIVEGNYNLSIDFFTPTGIVKREVNFSIDRTDPNFQINISCPCNLTSPLNLQMSMTDDHLESVYFQITYKDSLIYYEKDNVPYSETKMAFNRTLTLNRQGTYIFNIAILDSAGNLFEKTDFIGINGTKNDDWFSDYQPIFQQVNSTLGYVKLGQISSSLTPYLEYSTNYGQTWNIQSMEYNSSDSTYISYLSKTSPNFWYRIAANNGTNVFYYRMIRDHYWDNNIYYLNSTNLIMKNSGITSKTFSIYSLYNVNLNLSIYLKENQSYLELGNYSFLDNTFIFTLNNLDKSSSYVFIILIKTSITQFSIPIYIFSKDISPVSTKINYYNIIKQFTGDFSININNNASLGYVIRVSSLNYIYSISRLNFNTSLSIPSIGIYNFNVTYISPDGKNLLIEVYTVTLFLDFNVTFNGFTHNNKFYVGDQIQYNWSIISLTDINYKFYLNDTKIIDENYLGSKPNNASFEFNLKFLISLNTAGNYNLTAIISNKDSTYKQILNFLVLVNQNNTTSSSQGNEILNGSTNNSNFSTSINNSMSNLLSNPLSDFLIFTPILIAIFIIYYKVKKVNK